MDEDNSKDFYTFNEATEALGISRATLHRRLAEPDNFPNAWKTGPSQTSRWRIPIDDIEAFKKSHRRELPDEEEQTVETV